MVNQVKARIKELKHIRKVSKRNGFYDIVIWANGEIREMKAALKNMKKAPAATGTR